MFTSSLTILLALVITSAIFEMAVVVATVATIMRNSVWLGEKDIGLSF